MAQKHVPKPFLTCSWEILCEPLLLLGQFHGFMYLLNGQFQGICLEKSQPNKRTFPRRAAPLERTFGRVKAPSKPTLRLILLDLTKNPTPKARMQTFRPRQPAQSADRVTACPPPGRRSPVAPRCATPAFHPSDEDRSLGTPVFHPSDEDRSLGTPVFHPSDEDLSRGTPALDFRCARL
jgi:hypothetical protein